MLHPKVKSIIESCVNNLQLDTCVSWCEHIFEVSLMSKDDYSECLKLIEHRKQQIQITAKFKRVNQPQEKL